MTKNTLLQRIISTLAGLQIFAGVFGFATPSSAQDYSTRAADLMPPSPPTQTINNKPKVQIQSLTLGDATMRIDGNGFLSCSYTPPSVNGTVEVGGRPINLQDLTTQPAYVSVVPATYKRQTPERDYPRFWGTTPEPEASGFMPFVRLFNSNPQLGKRLVPDKYIISPEQIGESCGQYMRTARLTNQILSEAQQAQPPVAAQPSTEDTIAQIQQAMQVPPQTPTVNHEIKNDNGTGTAPSSPAIAENTTPDNILPYEERIAVLNEIASSGEFSPTVEECVIETKGGEACVEKFGTPKDQKTFGDALANTLAQARRAIAHLLSPIDFTRGAQTSRTPPAPAQQTTSRSVAAAAPSSPSASTPPVAVTSPQAGPSAETAHVRLPAKAIRNYAFVEDGDIENALEESLLKARIHDLDEFQIAALLSSIQQRNDVTGLSVVGNREGNSFEIFTRNYAGEIHVTKAKLPESQQTTAHTLSVNAAPQPTAGTVDAAVIQIEDAPILPPEQVSVFQAPNGTADVAVLQIEDAHDNSNQSVFLTMNSNSR